MNAHLNWPPLAELFDFVEDVLVWAKDRQGRYLWVNRSFVINYVTGGRPISSSDAIADVLGKTDYDLSPAFLADQFRLDDEYVLQGNRIVNRIELVGQPDGLTVWNLTNKIPLFDSEGLIIGTAGLTRRLNRPGYHDGNIPEFGPVLATMRDHFQTQLTNAHLAKLAHMSVRAFERKFQLSFHVTPQKYLRRLRMLMASRALVYSRQPLAEVAVGCGFSDQSHFTREFRRNFGRTPREYRDHYDHAQAAAAFIPNSAVAKQ